MTTRDFDYSSVWVPTGRCDYAFLVAAAQAHARSTLAGYLHVHATMSDVYSSDDPNRRPVRTDPVAPSSGNVCRAL